MFLGRIIVVVVVMAGLFTTPSRAQNLITNPNFDSDIVGWWNPSLDRLVWISDDGYAAGSGSGCLEFADTLNNGACTGAIQDNIAVTPNTTYLLSGTARLPTGSIADSASIWVQWYDGSGSYISSTTFNDVTTTVGGPWTTSSWLVESPPNAVEAWVRPSFCMPVGGPEESIARWDDLFFGLPGTEIFTDGFESSDTAAWSQTVP